MKIKNTLIISFAGLALSLSCAHAAIVFEDNFGGNTTDLDGASPDTGTGTWVASANFDRIGDVNITGAGAGSATLAFSPSQGNIYTAEASVSLSSGGSGDWFGFGFANGQSSTTSTNNRFLSGNVPEGRAWIYARENTNNPAAQLTGNADGTNWNGFTQSPSDIDFRITLDTTGGAGTWTATWFAKDSANSTFIEVRSSSLLGSEDINSIGFAVAGSGVTAGINSFSLTAVPEPSTYAAIAGLLGLGMVMFRRRRRE